MSLAKPRGLLTGGFDLLADDGTLLATMEGSLWREGGAVRIGTTTWELRRRGWSTFHLVRDGVDEAVARSRGIFSSKLDVEHPAGAVELARRSIWGRAYDVRQVGSVIGGIEPTSVWTNAAQVRLPDAMPLQLQVFLVAVVAIQWRRQQSSSSSGAGAGA